MQKITYFFLLIFLASGYFSACKHQKCPAYMTKEEVEATHKKASKKNKTKNKNLF
jgi:hypothetical protein